MLIPKQGVCYHTARRPGSYTVTVPQVARESRAAPPASTSEATRLEVSRDTWVSEVGQEADGNNGGAPRLKLKSIQEMTLIDVDPAGSSQNARSQLDTL